MVKATPCSRDSDAIRVVATDFGAPLNALFRAQERNSGRFFGLRTNLEDETMGLVRQCGITKKSTLYQAHQHIESRWAAVRDHLHHPAAIPYQILMQDLCGATDPTPAGELWYINMWLCRQTEEIMMDAMADDDDTVSWALAAVDVLAQNLKNDPTIYKERFRHQYEAAVAFRAGNGDEVPGSLTAQ